MAVGEALVHVRITLLWLWLGIFLFLSGWLQTGHSQYSSPPEVVIPLRVTGTGRGMSARGWLSYSLHFGGQRHIVHMKAKKLLVSRQLPVFSYTDQGALLEDHPFVPDDCYYHGYVESDPESLVALNTCSGSFHGTLQINDVAYEIKPKSGLCCKNCTFMPPGSVCREKSGECDLPEWCNGTSHECPKDVYVQNGMSCMGNGHCYEKICASRDEQCKQIFGKESRSANLTCYREINNRGDCFGNCGISRGSYVRCNANDILCGRVQCENVTEIPSLSNHRTLHCVQIRDNICRGSDYHVGMTIPDIGDVKDGTECGNKTVCINRRCVPMPLWTSDCSLETCNRSGICNNKNHCHCDYGWAPPDCMIEGYGGSVDSGPPPVPPPILPPKRRKNYWILLFFIFLIALLLCLLGILWKNKKAINKPKQNFAT
ncbi:Disintegrin and metalloproteinase domain-containing protein 25 [Heterocephalus glaber]|uniref:Disintegrin and metalloproteinase domain-containing protein 25 n=1 Tax=Heterocephalus glaber TaxID=10181 RepID=G5C135_HETGA|nr:Disintegrin and metalloproteinase domain-containing protein 25 [Heterocephalus glaber]